MRVFIAWKGRPRNDLYCVRRDVKPYSLTQSLSSIVKHHWTHFFLN